MNSRAVISGTGHYTPEGILTNADLERMVDTSDEWIITRTGIRERRIRADPLPGPPRVARGKCFLVAGQRFGPALRP